MNYKVPQSIQLLFSNFILRNIYKLIYKHSHPKTYRHNRRYWPYYSVKRNKFGGIDQIYFRKKLVVDNSVMPTNACKKSMLIATGPSIQKYPADVFQKQDIDYIGVNGSISLDNVQFKYYVIIDHNFTQNRFDLVLKVLQSQCTFFTTPRCLDIIFRKIHPDQIKCQIKVIETITEGKVERFLGPRITINPHQNYFYLEGNKGFSQHIHDSIFDYFTVPYVALQIVYALSYQEIYLAGLDMNNFNQPRFYEKSTNKQPTMLNQYLTEIFPAFEAASHFLNKQNIKVYNLSLKSAIESFEKLDPKLL
ncbi:lipopolysaccharide biosynthesis protein [Acinetobacter guillouiae]|uniref:lipopolysaccharide biosynthesis protein n=1 Tax=Acinetobacter guillouiae TaxID=106649 RepID=UPI0028D6C5ED|nr:lipopolysaccharide biosynthesis protein [Acinetobacter guillouiae]